MSVQRRVTRRFDWQTLSEVNGGWEGPIGVEISRMLELMPYPDEIEIILRETGEYW